MQMSKSQFIAKLLTAVLLVAACGPAAAATRIEGQVQGGGVPIANSTVTLWSASASAPSQLGQVKTDADGRFQFSIDQSPTKDASLYLVATGGEPAANKAGGNNPAIGLITSARQHATSQGDDQRVHDRGVGVDQQSVPRRHRDQG
jgi:hypothetical protein